MALGEQGEPGRNAVPLLPYSWSLQVRVEAHGRGRVGKGSLALLMLYPLYR